MKLPKSRIAIAGGVIALAFVVAAGWRWWSGSSSTPPAATLNIGNLQGSDVPEVPVTEGVARLADVPVTIDAVGTVQALNTATIRTQVDGRLVKLPFNEGEDVKKGDVVALIEPDLYQAQYDQAVAKKAQDEANLANARIDLVRYKKLTIGNYGSQQQYETQKWLVAQLEAQVRADQATIDSAKTTLGYTVIKSPIDGRTGIRLVDVGNILHASDLTGILIITQLKPIYVIFTIPQQALPAVQRAQENGAASVSALGPDNASVIEVGQVSVVDNEIDQTTGTARIRAIFANPALHLWPGQFVNVRLTVDTIKDAVVVPSPAIQRGPTGAFVYMISEGGAAVLRSITTGQQDENIAVVKQGLAAGDKIVTSGFARLSNGAKVRIVKPKESESKGTPTQDGDTRSWGDAKSFGGGEQRLPRDRGGRAAPPSGATPPAMTQTRGTPPAGAQQK
ncbi:MAG: efflux RND transporter periplasmic adaptor subunit [Methylocystis sp.]|jgi:multidrug efflux system membrane fusion protein